MSRGATLWRRHVAAIHSLPSSAQQNQYSAEELRLMKARGFSLPLKAEDARSHLLRPDARRRIRAAEASVGGKGVDESLCCAWRAYAECRKWSG